MAGFNLRALSLCPQCGSSAGFRYHRNETSLEQAACVATPGSEPGLPHMHRTCNTCTYGWAERP